MLEIKFVNVGSEVSLHDEMALLSLYPDLTDRIVELKLDGLVHSYGFELSVCLDEDHDVAVAEPIDSDEPFAVCGEAVSQSDAPEDLREHAQADVGALVAAENVRRIPGLARVSITLVL